MAVLPNIFVGRVTDDPFFQVGEEEISLKEMCDVWQKPLESVFPTKTNATKHNVSQPLYRTNDIYVKIKLQFQRYLFQYSQEQTVNTILQRHSAAQEQK